MAVLTSLQNGTSSNQNLVTGVTIQGYAASAGQYIRARAVIAQLNGAAATLTVGIRNTTDSAWAVEKYTVIKGTAADTAIEINFPPFFAQGKTYAMFIQSSNASDTTTPDVTGDWYDITKVDLDAVKGTSNNASGLGSAGGDYYNNTRFNANITGVDGVTATWSGVSGSVLFLRGTTWSTVAATDIVSNGAITTSSGAVSNVTTVGSVTTKTGYSLASNGLASVTSWTVNITGNITGNLSGSVGSISSVSNIVVGGAIVVVNNMVQSDVQKVMQSGDAALGLQMAGDKFKADEEFDVHVMTLEAAAIAAIQSGLMLASSYTAPPSASTIASQTITNLNADSGYITLKADAGTAATTANQANINTGTIITNLQTVDDNVDAIKLVTVKLDTMLVNDGGWKYSSFALANAPVTSVGSVALESSVQKVIKAVGGGGA